MIAAVHKGHMDQSIYTLAVDADGGDSIREGRQQLKLCERVYEATRLLLDRNPEVQIRMSGIPEDMGSLADKVKQDSRITFIPSKIHVPSDVVPSKTIWRDTAMYQLLTEVKENRAQGMYSSGNNKTYVVFTHATRLPRLEGIDRCPILAEVPTRGLESAYLLDVGATTDTTAEQLVQFAKIGAVYLKEAVGRNPRVGLLSNGREESKGLSNESKRAYTLLKEQKLPFGEFIGNVEPEHIGSGIADLVVCDGGAGNLCIKQMKETAFMVADRFKHYTKHPPWWAVPLWPFAAVYNKCWVGAQMKDNLHPSKFGGAIFLGYESGVLMKGHGSADTAAIYFGLKRLLKTVKADIPSKIKSALTSTQII